MTDPEHVKVDEEVKKTIDEIPSRFGQTAEKKENVKQKKAPVAEETKK